MKAPFGLRRGETFIVIMDYPFVEIQERAWPFPVVVLDRFRVAIRNEADFEPTVCCNLCRFEGTKIFSTFKWKGEAYFPATWTGGRSKRAALFCLENQRRHASKVIPFL